MGDVVGNKTFTLHSTGNQTVLGKLPQALLPGMINMEAMLLQAHVSRKLFK